MFRQTLVGLNGKPFGLYKFRTMVVLEDGEIVRQAQRSDVRVTRAGRILRLTGIDELLQLFNVLRGDMSLVGPRPHAAVHDKYFASSIPRYTDRWRAIAEPDWAGVHRELKPKHVTLLILWDEYIAANPGGYSYSRYVAVRFMLRE
jgi:lipopolysaccharide/colanic/teichoic acid biosynthesis glycosyltransferase